MFEISKDFEACYGHRVHSQKLDEAASCGSSCKCKHLHGHNAKIRVTLTSDKLDQQGMVTDFNNMAWFKKWVDANIDHKFIVDVHDPLLGTLIPKIVESGIKDEMVRCLSNIENSITFAALSEKAVTHLAQSVDERDYYESFVFIDGVPTSEVLSIKLAYRIEQILRDMDLVGRGSENNLRVKSVQFFETEKTSSTYIAG